MDSVKMMKVVDNPHSQVQNEMNPMKMIMKGEDENHAQFQYEAGVMKKDLFGRAIAQAVSRWLPTAAVRGSKPDLGMWDLWWDKVALGRFSPSSSVSPAIVVCSTNYSTITLIYHPGKMYNRPMCGRSTGDYTNLGDLQRDLMGVKSHPTK
jgi:hypothetical protein